MYKIFILIGFISCFAVEGLIGQDTREEAVLCIKEGALVVRLFNLSTSTLEYKRLSESEKVPADLRERMRKKYEEVAIEHDSFIRRYIEIFEENYNYSRVVFVKGDDFVKFREGQRDSVFVDHDLNYISLDYEIAEEKYVYVTYNRHDLSYKINNAENEFIKGFTDTYGAGYNPVKGATTGSFVKAFFGVVKRYDEDEMNGLKIGIKELSRKFSKKYK